MAIFDKKAPGVYIEEIPGGARPITTPSTAVLGIVGLCRDQVLREDLKTGEKKWEPTLEDREGAVYVTSWKQFTDKFGKLADASVPNGALHRSMWGFFMNGGQRAYVAGIPVKVTEKQPPPRLLTYSTTLQNATHQDTLRLTTKPLEQETDITVQITAPTDPARTDAFNMSVQVGNDKPTLLENVTLGSGKGNLKTALKTSALSDLLIAEAMAGTGAEMVPAPSTITLKIVKVDETAKGDGTAKDEVATVDLPTNLVDLFVGDAGERKGIMGLEAVDDVTIVICPDILTLHREKLIADEDVKRVQSTMIAHCEKMKDRFAILDTPYDLNMTQVKTWRGGFGESGFAAMYYPWIQTDKYTYEPPSALVAGVYSRTDTARGVHKAPANEEVFGAIGLRNQVTQAELGDLNDNHVNVIRDFPNRGIRIWGARTLNKAEWKYINVRRLFSNIEEAILQGTQWTVFEPNDRVLWAGIRREVSDYLTLRWREGALFGATPEEAFYVVCDESLNDEKVRDQGYCLIEVGIAPVKPAEFVVFMIRQKRDGVAA